MLFEINAQNAPAVAQIQFLYLIITMSNQSHRLNERQQCRLPCQSGRLKTQAQDHCHLVQLVRECAPAARSSSVVDAWSIGARATATRTAVTNHALITLMVSFVPQISFCHTVGTPLATGVGVAFVVQVIGFNLRSARRHRPVHRT